MRRLIALLLTVILFSGVTVMSFADSVRVPIDLNAMKTDELLALFKALSLELADRGYLLSIDTNDQIPSAEGEGIDSSEANDFRASEEPQSLFEGSSELSDSSFLQDLASGLEVRWDIADNTDISLMSDSQLTEYSSRLVNSELAYMGKYTEFEFEDEKLEDYAHNYINALQLQYIAVSEYFGVDEKNYNEYWQSGYAARAR